MKKQFVTLFIVVLLGTFAVISASFAAYKEEKGVIKGKVKLLNEKGRYERVSGAKVYLMRYYKSSENNLDRQFLLAKSYSGNPIKEKDKSDSRGRYEFDDLTDNKKYRIGCKKDGYFSAKDQNKKRYVSDKVTVRAGEIVYKSCRLQKIPANVNNQLVGDVITTGGGINGVTSGSGSGNENGEGKDEIFLIWK